MAEPTPAPDPLAGRLALTADEACQALGIGRNLLWSKTKSGEIPHVRIGNRLLYPVDELRKWLSTQASKGGRK